MPTRVSQEMQARISEALCELGEDTTFEGVSSWLRKKYGSGCSDATFYAARKAHRCLLKLEKVVFTPDPVQEVEDERTPYRKENGFLKLEKVVFTPDPVQEVVEDDNFTLKELRTVAVLAKLHGGRDRLRRILQAIDHLTD